MTFSRWLGLSVPRKPLDVGEAAPDASTVDALCCPVHLRDLYGPDYTLVYFYPKADTPGCTAQACSLRDDLAALQDHGVKVVGVSSDRPDAQRKFADKFKLTFTLLADSEHQVSDAFGVRLIFGQPLRKAFLMRHGQVVWRDLTPSTRYQARDILNAVAKLAGKT